MPYVILETTKYFFLVFSYYIFTNWVKIIDQLLLHNKCYNFLLYENNRTVVYPFIFHKIKFFYF